MKKVFTRLTGIVLLITILIAGGCMSADDPGNTASYPEIVTIYLKAYEEGEGMKLKMYDSKNATPVEARDHYADVGPGTKVVWRRAEDSGITSIKKVGPKAGNGPIFPGEATTIILHKRLRIWVPDDASVPRDQDDEIVEKYGITFKDKKYKREWSTDPYLKIPDLRN